MKRSDKRHPGIRRTAFFLITLSTTALALAAWAEAAPLPAGASGGPCLPEAWTPAMAQPYPAHSPALDVEVYLVFEATCRSMHACLGIPVSAANLMGGRVRLAGIPVEPDLRVFPNADIWTAQRSDQR